MPHRARTRRRYAALFFVVAASMGLLGVFAWIGERNDAIWPGDPWWTWLYWLAGLGALAAGVDAVTPGSPPRVTLRRLGIRTTALLLICRGLGSAAAFGVGGMQGLTFLWCFAFALLWAEWAIEQLPPDPADWHDLRDRYRRLADQLDDT